MNTRRKVQLKTPTPGLGFLPCGEPQNTPSARFGASTGLTTVGNFVAQLGGDRRRQRKRAGHPRGRNSRAWSAEAVRGKLQILACKYKFATTQSAAQRPIGKNRPPLAYSAADWGSVSQPRFLSLIKAPSIRTQSLSPLQEGSTEACRRGPAVVASLLGVASTTTGAFCKDVTDVYPAKGIGGSLANKQQAHSNPATTKAGAVLKTRASMYASHCTRREIYETDANQALNALTYARDACLPDAPWHGFTYWRH